MASSVHEARCDSNGVSLQILEKSKAFQDSAVAVGWQAYLKELQKHSSPAQGQKQTKLNCSLHFGGLASYEGSSGFEEVCPNERANCVEC